GGMGAHALFVGWAYSPTDVATIGTVLVGEYAHPTKTFLGKRLNLMKRRKRARRPKDEGSYVCPSCGEQIVIPLDRSGGTEQKYVEDCPVCCNPNLIQVEF